MPAWITPLEWPVWWVATAARARARDLASGWRSASSRAAASPTIPAPTTATSHSLGGPAVVGSAGANARQSRIESDDLVMALPLKPPIKPQLALSRKQLPEGEEWSYEQKWDGFRAIAFVDGDKVHVQSRNGKPLGRYFPSSCCPRGATSSTASS